MVRGGEQSKDEEGKNTKASFEDDLDALFKLPLTEFTGARNALASRLKKTGHNDEAARVKALVKPSISAWAVNQLYWKHQGDFKKLIAAGERFTQAQASQFAGKDADLRGALAARRETLSSLSHLVDALLRNAGHNATPDTLRRINTTLEALSTYSSSADGPRPGRLTEDLDPPGFESLAALIPGGVPAKRPNESARITPLRPSPKPGAGKREERDEARIASARNALLAAQQALREARATAEDLAAARKKAAALVDETERNGREAAERLEKAELAAQQARQRLHSVTAEAEKAAKVLSDAERRVDKARKELDETSGVRA